MRILLAALLLAIVLVLGRVLNVAEYLLQAMHWIDSLGFTGVFAYIGLYGMLSVLLVPGSILTLAAGAVFGVVRGSIYASLGSTLGATLAFLLGRYVARDSVRRLVNRKPVLSAVDQAIGREGWKIVGLLRLSPVVPWSMSNYVYGVTAVRPISYVLASWIGMLPGTVVYVYIGSLLGIVAVDRDGMTPGQWFLTVAGLIATVAVTVMITRIARRAVAEHVTESPPLYDRSPGTLP